ncbi:MAG TPA: ABC transporter permease [Thermoanaerobaculia bacterium]|nr:ABC transporter permease [Thermoanaerobaculia bacterium]
MRKGEGTRASARAQSLRSFSEFFILRSAFCVLVLLIWHFAVVVTGATIFPSPIAVAKGLTDLPNLASYIRDSLFRVAAGYSAAVLLGVPVGLALDGWSSLARAANPVIQMLRPISPLAWMPLAVIWFGVSNLAPIFLIFLASFFPIVVATMNGVRNVPPVYVQAGRNFGLSTRALIAQVVFPAVLPRIVVGLRLAFGVAWIVLVAAEMIAVDSGLGYMIIDARNAGKRYDLVVGGMLTIGLIGLILDALIRRTERLRFVRWAFRD